MNDSSPGSSPAERSMLNGEAGGSAPPLGSTYHYVIVRKGISPATIIAQAVHAAGESASAFTKDTGFDVGDTTRAVVLGATKEELAKARFDLEEAGVSFVAIIETENELANVLTAVGLVTMDRDYLKPILGHLRPWRP